MDVVGIVLGAGRSTRLGRPKQTLPFGATTVLGHVVAAAEASQLTRVVVVLGGAEPEVRAALEPDRAQLVSNEAYGTGCASSLLAGLDATGTADAVMLLLGDMPGVDAPVIDSVLAHWSAVQPWAAVTAYTDRVGHPFMFSSDAFATLRGLHGDKAVWKIVDNDPSGRVAQLRISQPCPRDIDTWDDYRALVADL